MHHILELLDRTAAELPRASGFCDETTTLTWQQIARSVQGVGTALDALPGGVFHRPVGVYMDRDAAALTAMLGVLAAGGFYTVLDTAQPPERVRAILDQLQERGMAADVGYIDMTNINSPSFSYLGRFIVKLGSFEETEYRFGKLLSAVSQLVEGDRGTIDVSPEGAQTVFSPF